MTAPNAFKFVSRCWRIIISLRRRGVKYDFINFNYFDVSPRRRRPMGQSTSGGGRGMAAVETPGEYRRALYRGAGCNITVVSNHIENDPSSVLGKIFEFQLVNRRISIQFFFPGARPAHAKRFFFPGTLCHVKNSTGQTSVWAREGVVEEAVVGDSVGV